MKKIKHNKIYNLFLILSLIFFLLSILKIFLYFSESEVLIQKTKIKGTEICERAAKKIENKLKNFISVTDEISKDITSGKLPLSKSKINKRLRKSLKSDKLCFGVGILFAPYAFSSEVKLYGPYYYRNKSSEVLLNIEEKYDYTDKTRLFYNEPMRVGNCWIPPHYTKITKKYVTEYASVFKLPNRKTDNKYDGIVFLNYSMSGINSIMSSINFGNSGYSFVISKSPKTKKGLLIYHPNHEYVKSKKTLKDVAILEKNDELKKIADKVIIGKSGVFDFYDKSSGHPAWLFYHEIPLTKWVICVVILKDEVLVKFNKTSTKKKIVILILTILFLLFLYSALTIKHYHNDLNDLWYFVFFVSLIFIIGIGLIWYFVVSRIHSELGEEIPIVNKTTLNQFVNSYDKKCKDLRLPKPIFIPCGIIIQSLQFMGSNNIMVTGYIWNKIPNKLPYKIKEGVILPESIDSNNSQLKEVYRKKQKDYTIVGWYFENTIRQSFNYSTYPLDEENIWVKIWPYDFHKNIVLIPDIDGYSTMLSSLKPGLEKNFVLEEWDIENTFFSFRNGNYNTNFGINNFEIVENKPELYFNVLLKRNFISPFISDLLPLIVVSIMLFSLMLVITKNNKINELVGFSASDVINACAALFFVVIITQVQMREKLQSPYIIYLEYFYFTSYFMLLGVAIDALIFSWTNKYNVIQYEDNLIPKLIFWPLSLGIMFIITVLIFYK